MAGGGGRDVGDPSEDLRIGGGSSVAGSPVNMDAVGFMYSEGGEEEEDSGGVGGGTEFVLLE